MVEHPQFYKDNPRAAWGMKARVINTFLTKEPHEGYHILNGLTNKNIFVVTSNIDVILEQLVLTVLNYLKFMDDSKFYNV